MVLINTLKQIALRLILPVIIALPASAGTISGILEFGTSDFPDQIAVGDRYAFSLTIDENAPSTGGNTFHNSLTAFSFTADPANTGTWAQGTFDITPVSNFVVNTAGENATIQIHGSGFGDLDGNPFFDLEVRFDFPSDLVSGATLAEVGNGVTLDYFNALSAVTVRGRLLEIDFTDAQARLFEPTGTISVPTPPTALLLLVGLGGLVMHKRLTKSIL